MKGREPEPRRGQGSLGRRLIFSFVTCALVGLGGSGWILYWQALASLEDQLASHLKVEARMIAAELARNSITITSLRPGMEGFREYQRLRKRLRGRRARAGSTRAGSPRRGR